MRRSRSSRRERSFSTHYNRVMRIGRAIVAVVIVAVAAVIALRLIAQSSLRLRPYASGFTNPLAIVQDPGDRSVQFVLEQAGRIRVVRDGVILDSRLPRSSRRHHVGRRAGPARTRVSTRCRRARASSSTSPIGLAIPSSRGSGDRRPTGSSRIRHRDSICAGAPDCAFVRQPFANHNGGHLAFGPDGFLYVGLGDGGSGDDPDHRAQDPAELLGKMLRIDVNVPDAHPSGYRGAGRQSVRQPRAVSARRSGPSACATRGATRFDDRQPRRHRRDGDRRRRPEPHRGDRLRTARTRRPELWLAQP